MKNKRAIQKRTFHYMVLVFFLMLGVIAVGDATAQTDPMIAGG